MLRLNQNIPLGFFIDLKWAARGPVKAKSLLHGRCEESVVWGGPAACPARPALGSRGGNRLPWEVPAPREATGGEGEPRCPRSLRRARSPPPSPGRVRLRRRRARPAGLSRGGTSRPRPSGPSAALRLGATSIGRAKASVLGVPWQGRTRCPEWVRESPNNRRDAAPVRTRDGERPGGRGLEAGFGGRLRAGASPGSAPCGCRRRPGQSRPAALPPRRGWDIKAASE